MKIPRVSIKLVKEEEFEYNVEPVLSVERTANFFIKLIGDSDREKFVALYLDVKNVPNCIEIISIGSLNSSIVTPREVFKSAVMSNSNSIIVAHNHPSGSLEPSKEDVNVTLRLKEAGKILGIQLLDHIIVNYDGKYVSLKEKGVI